MNRAVNALGLREIVRTEAGGVAGGCRLYAQEKRRRLIAAGIAPDRLALWDVVEPVTGGLHRVLLIDGDRVLDNLDFYTETRAFDERRGYLFISPVAS